MDLKRLSCCSYPLRERPVEEALSTIAAAGFKKVDLLGRMPHLSLDPEECDPQALLALARKHGLQIANLGTYVGRGFAEADSATQFAALEEMRRAIDLAVLFGARSIRVFAGNDDPACTERIVPWYRRSADYAEEKGVYLGIENHGGGISGKPERVAELAARVGSPNFGALYEPFNLMAHGEDYRRALETMKDCIVHTHFKDGRMTPQGFQLTMMGEGEIDFRWIMQRLAELGYEGDFAFEYELEAPAPAVGLKTWYAAAEQM